MQRFNLSFICVLLNVILGFAANSISSAQMLDSKLPNQEYDIEKVNADYSLLSNRDISQLDEQGKVGKADSKEIVFSDNLQRNPHIKWYLVSSKPFGDGRQSMLVSPEQQPAGNRLIPLADRVKLWPFISRQLSKKQTHLKKNNPRDILRGLAVKRDRFYK